MHNILAFETSTDVCSVAFQNEEGQIFEKRIRGRSVHSDHVFLFIRELMKEHHFSVSELNAVLVSNGPGSYTGLRIAASAIKGFLFGTEVSVFAGNTLAAFAQSVVKERPETIIHAIIDARRVHVYHQSFEVNDTLKATSAAAVIKLEEFEAKLGPDQIVIGTGIDRLSERALSDVTTFGPEHISAVHLITLFNRQPDSEFFTIKSAEALDPDYLTSNQINNTSS